MALSSFRRVHSQWRIFPGTLPATTSPGLFFGNRHNDHVGCCNEPSNTSVRRFASSSDREKGDSTFDVLIVGGGVVGSALARQLSSLSYLKIGLIEAGPGPPSCEKNNAMNTPSIPHPRSYALSPASLDILGISYEQAQELGGCYETMQVWEANHPASLLWSTEDLDNSTPAGSPPFLGCCLEDHVLQRHLWRELKDTANTHIFPNTTLQNIQFPSENGAWVTAETKETSDDASSTGISTQLLVAADGVNSHIRRAAGIGVRRIEYGQTAVTCTVELAEYPKRHQRSFQRFVGGQPLALLPTRSPQHAVIVWSTTPDQAANTSEEDLLPLWNDWLQTGPQPAPPLFSSRPLQSLVDTVQYGGALLGATDGFSLPPPIQKIVSPIFRFPLAWQQATASTTDIQGVALVGDAAGTVHPMAGQGLNIGLQGVQRLAHSIQRAAGLPVTTFLEPSSSSPPASVGIHVLQRLFQEQGTLWQNAKCAGMNVVQTVGPVRRALVRAACYGV